MASTSCSRSMPASTPVNVARVSCVESTSREYDGPVASMAAIPTAPLDDPRLHGEAPWLPFVRAALGPAAVEVHRGFVVNYLGSETQRWRAEAPTADGDATRE